MGVCPGIWRDPGPANPRDWNRDSRLRDNRDKNLQGSRATKIPRDNKSRDFGTRILLSPGTVTVSRNFCFYVAQMIYVGNCVTVPRDARPDLFWHYLYPVGPGPEQKSVERAGRGQICAKLSRGISGTATKIAGLSRSLPMAFFQQFFWSYFCVSLSLTY